MLEQLQGFEPVGLFARNLAECLTLQAKERKEFDAPMKIDVGRAASDIASAIRRGDPVVYIPRRWRAIMTAVQLIPPSLFKRLKV